MNGKQKEVRMKRTRVLISVVAFVVFLSSMSFANGLNLNALGPRAVAMGGAFVGLADDYSAVFWNPAGLTNINQKYIAFYGFDVIPSMTYKLETPIPGLQADAKSVTKHYLGGFVGYFQPITENIVAGLAVYSPSGLGIEWDGKDLAGISSGNTNIEWMSKFFVITIAPTMSFKVNEMFMLGFALNINYGSFEMNRWAGSTLIPVPPYTLDFGQQSLKLNGWGFGATLGLLVKPSDMFSLGLTVRTPSKIGFSGDIGIENLDKLGPLFGTSISSTSEAETDLTMPLWLAGGIAFKPTEKFTLTFDVHWTQWSKIDEVKLKLADQTWGLILDEEDTKLAFRWKNATQIRFGAEYWISPKFALRAGYYIDPEPAIDETRNILLPITDFNSITAGFGYNVNGIIIDFGFEYITGKKQEVSLLDTLTDPAYQDAMPGKYHMKTILAFDLSVSYKW
jgi:long-chain fatty acid transport protein